MQDSLLKRVIRSPYTPKALMSSTGEAWEEGAPHTGLFWSGQAHNWMVWYSIWCASVYTVQCTHLLRATQMPSKNYPCQWARQDHDQKWFGAVLADCSYPQPVPLNSATRDRATQGSRKIGCFVFFWHICILKNQFRISHLYVTWLNSILFSRN